MPDKITRRGYGTYCGQMSRYEGCKAQLRETQDYVLARFDDSWTGMMTGWHPFEKNEFTWEAEYK